jgi:hypothetical protein
MKFHDLLTMIPEDPEGAEAAIHLDPSALIAVLLTVLAMAA